MKLVSVAEMQAIEREADQSGHSYAQMMEHAGRGLAGAVAGRYADLPPGGVLGLVGSGNNGGDTLVALAHLAAQGWKAAAYLVRPRDEGDPLIQRLKEAGGDVFRAAEDPGHETLGDLLHEHGVVLDGVLGTGIRLPLREEVARVLDFAGRTLAAMEEPPRVVAVDCPSGVDSDSGQAAPETIPADLTVTMAAVKQGLLKFPAFALLGDLEVVGIGLPQDGESLESWRRVQRTVPAKQEIHAMLPPRPMEAHKGTFGTALVIGGSLSYTGAVLLAGKAAYRAGAGLVTMGVPASLHAALAGHFPEATWLLLPDWQGAIASRAAEMVQQNLERPTALVIGPGFGLAEETERFLDQLLDEEHLPPAVIDADGLKLLGRLSDWSRRLPQPAVLTPHPGEMSVLTGLSTREIQDDRLNVASRFSREWGHVVVLKGAFTVIAAPDGQQAVIPVATPALARAGTGDVLAGLIGGLLAQGMDAYEAAIAGAWIHAHAGLYAEENLGSAASVLAGDVLAAVPEVLADLP